MNLADLSIKRPIFVTCIIVVTIVMGLLAMVQLPVEQMPDMTLPTINVSVVYPGAGPEEIETLITKPLEDELGTISGIKNITSKSIEGYSQVIADFRYDVDPTYAEQQVRDKVTLAKTNFPRDNSVGEPSIRRFDPADDPILTLAVHADVKDHELYDLADRFIKVQLEQVANVGLIQISGGRKREIQVQLDREKLKRRQLSVTQVTNQLQAAGENVPGGKINEGDSETLYRSLGEFRSLSDIASIIVNFQDNEVPTRISDLGKVTEDLEDETTRSFVNGKKALFLNVYRQSGSNTLKVTKELKEMIVSIENQLKENPVAGNPKIEIVQDGSKAIDDNVWDVQETILIGIALTILVVFLFLGSGRSTLITCLALPNSLLGAFVIMSFAGFSINVVSLLALSLAVGLLIDDAIVVRENIFRHIEMGKDPESAARIGTKEVTLAVIATTAVVMAIFAPVGFMGGVIGQFLKQFGLTVCFAMAISLFDALTIAPMLSTYLAEAHHEEKKETWWGKIITPVLNSFNRMNSFLEEKYGRILSVVLKHPLKTLGISVIVFAICTATVTRIPLVLIPSQDSREISVRLKMPVGTSLDAMSRYAVRADEIVRAHTSEVSMTTLTVGTAELESNEASMYVRLQEDAKGKLTTAEFRTVLEKEFAKDELVSKAEPKVSNYDNGPADSDVTLNIVGLDQEKIQKYSALLTEKMKADPTFRSVESSYRPGKPEFQLLVKPGTAPLYGVNTKVLGDEIRAQVEGTLAAKFRENSQEYNVRVRLDPEQRNLRENFDKILVPNMTDRLIRLSDVAEGKIAQSAASIDRVNRSRYVQVTANVVDGVGTNESMAKIDAIVKNEIKLPSDIRLVYAGESELFEEMITSFVIAIGLGIIFIFLVLASLYESFITPFTIMLALPLAICGAFAAIYLTNESISLFGMLGLVMLLGVACKNSILLVDATKHLIENGKSRSEALIEAGKIRLRPILMTSIALIAGAVPIAIGLNAASAQRTGMGVAIIGGLVSSTLLTLFVVPAAFEFIDDFRLWLAKFFSRFGGSRTAPQGSKK